jgi:hypothetical protein
MLALGLAALLVTAAGGFPASAEAHGPVSPSALSYLARVRSVPPGLEAKVVDGDQRMWLRVPATETVVVLDYRRAPYLRFSRSGVEVNHNSVMYYLNQTPFALKPPADLGPNKLPKWERVTAGHEYGWHDGRLHALASVARRGGASFLGTWRVPIRIDGRLLAISGGLWHAAPPSIVWFWPIAVLVLCVLAAWRVRSPALDDWTARLLGLAALGAVAAAAVGRGLHGRPDVSVVQLVELGIVLAFVAWGLFRVVVQRPGFFSYLVIAIVALWEGLELIPTLVNGFVLIALPAFVARAAAVVGVGSAVCLVLMIFRLHDLELDEREAGRSVEQLEGEDEHAWELA